MKREFDVIPYLEDLWRYGRVLTRNDADADDVVQEALVRALSSARTYDPNRPLLPWLICIVRNTFLGRASRAEAERRHLACYAQFNDDTLLPSQEHSVELAQVRRALRSLSIEHAEVLHLVAVLGLTYAEAAEILEVPKGTVMSRLSRARAALAEVLEDKASSTGSRLRVVGGRNEHG